jgi:membrane protein required for beta-lactamase induction
MPLIFILIALGFDFFLGNLERYRNYDWIISLYHFLEKRLALYKYWDGSLGLLGLLAIPVLVLLLIVAALDHWSSIAEGIFVLLVLIYCLAPESLDNRLDQYITAIDEDDEDSVSSLTEKLVDVDLTSDEDLNETAIIKSVFVEAHKRSFAVIFWFLILGVVGALLYRLVNELNEEMSDVRSGYSDSTNVLLNILEWPSSRIMIIGLGLAGSLVHAFTGWQQSEKASFDVNSQVLSDAGIGALQYIPDMEVPGREKSYWIGEVKSLINRTLIICLAVLAIMTLSGKLG